MTIPFLQITSKDVRDEENHNLSRNRRYFYTVTY